MVLFLEIKNKYEHYMLGEVLICRNMKNTQQCQVESSMLQILRNQYW